jgi:hypothetical protein
MSRWRQSTSRFFVVEIGIGAQRFAPRSAATGSRELTLRRLFRVVRIGGELLSPPGVGDDLVHARMGSFAGVDVGHTPKLRSGPVPDKRERSLSSP